MRLYTIVKFSFLVIPVIFYHCSGKTADEWKRRIIYQLLTDRFAPSGELPSQNCSNLKDYCGGTFKGIEQHLDYIAGLGANAIWISPIVQNIDKGYHGYWAQNIFEINPHFGTREDLKSLIKACHDRDVWVMADLVANHMGYPPNAGWPARLVPFNDSEYFHPSHAYIKWPEECKDQWKIENYWLANLPDLNQSHPFVHQTLLNWVHNLTNQFNFDGYRLDTTIQVPKTFWAEFRKAGGGFMMGEANNGPPPCGSMEYVGGYQGYIDSVLAYPDYWTLREIFQEKNKNFTALSIAVKKSYQTYKDRSIFGGFVDNHDNPRFLYLNPNHTALRNELTFVMMGDWIPIVYYGTEQGFNGGSDPNNRESLWPNMSTEHPLYKFIQILTRFRTSLGDDWLQNKQVERHVQADAYAFSRGQIMVVVAAQDKTVSLTIANTPYKPGMVLKNVLNFTEEFTVSSDGSLQIILNSGEPIVLQQRTRVKNGAQVMPNKKVVSFLNFQLFWIIHLVSSVNY